MSDDAKSELKTSLAKVLQSHGKRRFFFAYGTGKRADGHGDGHLVVGPKKWKKADVQAACACTTFVEGRCWSSVDGETVFFASKTKLAAPTVAKMALTAKKVSGRQFDFQVPSPEEEARAEKLTDTEEPPTEPPAGGRTEDAPPSPTSESPPTPPPTADGAEAFAARLKEMLPDILQAQAGKAPQAPEIKLRASEAQMFARKKDFARALAVLDQIETLLKAPGEPTPTPKKSDADGVVPKGLVKYRTALLKFRDAMKGTQSRLDALRGQIARTLPQEAAMAKELATHLGARFSVLSEAIDAAINAADANQREPYNNATRTLIKKYIAELASDPLVAHVDRNPFTPTLVRQSLTAALQGIESTMV